jgi:hypothetical protein
MTEARTPSEIDRDLIECVEAWVEGIPDNVRVDLRAGSIRHLCALAKRAPQREEPQ